MTDAAEHESDYDTIESEGEQQGPSTLRKNDLDKQTQELIKVLKEVPAMASKNYGKKGPRKPNVATKKKRKLGSPNSTELTSDNELSESQNNLLAALLEEVKGLRQVTSAIDTRLSNIENNLGLITARLNTLEEENKQMKDELKEKDKLLANVTYKFDSIEQKERRFQLIISSPVLSSFEEDKFKDKTINHIMDKLSLSNDFLRRFSYRRIGRDGYRRALVEAKNQEDRLELLKTARLIKPDNFYIAESLIKSREDLLYELRRQKKDKGLNFLAYSFKGEIFAKTAPSSNPYKIMNSADITRFFATL